MHGSRVHECIFRLNTPWKQWLTGGNMSPERSHVGAEIFHREFGKRNWHQIRDWHAGITSHFFCSSPAGRNILHAENGTQRASIFVKHSSRPSRILLRCFCNTINDFLHRSAQKREKESGLKRVSEGPETPLCPVLQKRNDFSRSRPLVIALIEQYAT